LFIFLFSGQPIFAYIDPGTGSYMLQIAIAFLVGALFTIKGFWKK
jgi:hydrogenase-4 membrane subunit HyfE